jgi:hypothetical protein
MLGISAVDQLPIAAQPFRPIMTVIVTLLGQIML